MGKNIWLNHSNPPGTEAKFITKSRSLELLPNRITSAEYKAWICTADDCTSVCPNCTKPHVRRCQVKAFHQDKSPMDLSWTL